MSCPLTTEVILLDSDRTHRDSGALEAHAEGCPTCGEALAGMRRARSLLSHFAPEPNPFSKARLWREIEDGEVESDSVPRWTWIPLGGAALALAVAMLYVLFRGEPGEAPGPRLAAGAVRMVDPAHSAPEPGIVPRMAWVRVESAARAELGAAKAELAAGSIFYLDAPAPRKTDLRLYRGQVTLDLEPLPPGAVFEVNTRQARLAVIGTRLEVTASDAGTAIHVERGRVRVELPGAPPVTLGAGDRIQIAAEPKVARQLSPGPLPAPEPAAKPAAIAPPAPRVASPAAAAPAGPAALASRAALDEARAVLESDAPRAAAIASRVLETRPDEGIEIDALVVLADAERRSGKRASAAERYRAVADHSRGRPFAEEALLRRASLLAELGRREEAKLALASAESRFGAGVLGPERCRLEAELLLQSSDRSGAVIALEKAIGRAQTAGDSATARELEARLSGLR